MLKILLVLFLCGCTSLERSQQQIDTALNKSERDWVEVYRYEMKVAGENDDSEAWSFFFTELIKEKIRLSNKELD